jgi:hypothetical protein
VNQKLSANRIRTTCRELLANGNGISGRGLRDELRRRFGAGGKTERVFRIWREETHSARAAVPAKAESLVPAPAPEGLPSAILAAEKLPLDVRLLQQRLLLAESVAADSLARAERAEYREQAHQEKWAVEIDRLRQATRSQPDMALTIRKLQEQVFELSRKLGAARDGSAV